jgi:serine/threonine protein kinase
MHRLSHPHIIQFKDWYETKNNLWLILEYCTGGDLQSLLKQDGHIPEASVRMFTLDILAGLKVSPPSDPSFLNSYFSFFSSTSTSTVSASFTVISSQRIFSSTNMEY